MAQQKTKRKSSKRSSKSSTNSSRGGRSSSQKPEKYRFAQNVPGNGTMAEREYQGYAKESPQKAAGEADVLLDVPVLKVDQIHLKVEDLQARVSVQAEVRDLLKLNVGVHASLGKVELNITGVEAQALLKVRLDHIAAIIDRVLTTVDRNPELLRSVGQAAEEVGKGTGHFLGETGEAVEDVGEGAKEGLPGVGKGAGQAVGEIGQGAGQALGGLGQAAGGAAGGGGGGGAGQALGQAAGALGQAAGGAVGAAGKAAGDAGDIAAGDIAKLTTKTAAKEVGQAAKLEAKGLRVAASRKAQEMKERRRQRKAERYDATEKAYELANELDVDLEEVDGSGAEGRITVADVRRAAD